MAYCDKTKVENYLAVIIPDALAEQVASWCKAVSSYIDRYTGRSFEPVDVDTDEPETLKYDGNGRQRLDIDDCLEVDSVVVDGSEVTDFLLYPANETPKTAIELKQGFARNSRLQLIQGNSPYVFERGQQNVEVTGWFGYSAETPDDIVLAATKLVGGIIKEAVGDKDIKEMTAEKLGDYAVDYAKVSEVAHGLSVSSLLDPFIRTPARARTAVYEL